MILPMIPTMSINMTIIFFIVIPYIPRFLIPPNNVWDNTCVSGDIYIYIHGQNILVVYTFDNDAYYV